jgi:hypothetical protein
MYRHLCRCSAGIVGAPSICPLGSMDTFGAGLDIFEFQILNSKF